MKKRVMFLCTHNSCRSQMAEGLINADLGERFQAFSAGTEAHAGNPMAARALAERVPHDPDGALKTVAAARLTWDVAQGRALITETVAFWNALVAPA